MTCNPEVEYILKYAVSKILPPFRPIAKAASLEACIMFILLARYSCLWEDSDTDTEFESSLLIRVLANSVFSSLLDSSHPDRSGDQSPN
jgi:hypothetical protein